MASGYRLKHTKERVRVLPSYRLRHTMERVRVLPENFDLTKIEVGRRVPMLCYTPQRCHDCHANAAAFIVGYEYKKTNPEVKDYHVSRQQFIDHVWRHTSVDWYRETEDEKYEECAEDDDKAHHYLATGLQALEYAARCSGGIAMESNYRYVGKVQPFKKIPKAGPKVTGITVSQVFGHSHAKQEIFNGHPIIAYVRQCSNFSEFRGKGVFKKHAPVDENSTSEGHIVALVGFGIDEDLNEYYIVRNSVGRTWGDNGYAKVLCSLIEPHGFVDVARV
ncbi:hypothetical protein ABFS82_06G075700 [Erythranthe guttata]|uniref:KDEL-tailed cysteine endopeptidase CEP3-like n=1 Tax=Erythranthe guttata TaxID=4155 RepID=UPI00064DD83C|nr:PREDICTED: KDEL-tailed cysteine endopeptidase CEP3-like [Erythranthe guttata]|eukprot:XP_012858892.1 PREDICTED: KDEL-tailed cysteine endopeptidase CEP3-like [Erythranthe guttata]